MLSNMEVEPSSAVSETPLKLKRTSASVLTFLTGFFFLISGAGAGAGAGVGSGSGATSSSSSSSSS